MSYWILKTEPTTYSFTDLLRDKVTAWDGVRNYQARNNLKLMKIGDNVMIYHSGKDREIVGLAKVTKTASKDKSAEEGEWVQVEISSPKALKNPLSLSAIKKSSRLKDLSLVKQSRLSVCPVSKDEWKILLELSA